MGHMSSAVSMLKFNKTNLIGIIIDIKIKYLFLCVCGGVNRTLEKIEMRKL